MAEYSNRHTIYNCGFLDTGLDGSIRLDQDKNEVVFFSTNLDDNKKTDELYIKFRDNNFRDKELREFIEQAIYDHGLNVNLKLEKKEFYKSSDFKGEDMLKMLETKLFETLKITYSVRAHIK